MSETPTQHRTERLDELLSLLADGERRTILAHLRNRGTGTTSLDSLATVLASDSSVEQDHARVRLHHTHLPKLAQTPLLDYDPVTTTVEYHRDPEFELLLNSLPGPGLSAPGTDF